MAPPAEAQKALGPGFFGGPAILPPKEPPAPRPATAIDRMVAEMEKEVRPPPANVSNVLVESQSEEVSWTHGEELYGKQGTFSQYRVGPFTGKTRVRAGETHAAALRRLKAEIGAEADVERAAAHERFMAHWKKNVAGAG